MEHKNCLKKVTAVFSAHEAAPIWKLRHFAVLALLTEIGGELHFILTKRAAGDHYNNKYDGKNTYN